MITRAAFTGASFRSCGSRFSRCVLRFFAKLESQGGFLGIHWFTNTVKGAFFRGTSLHPVPPSESKSRDTRYLDIHERDRLDEAQLAAWVKQVSQLPSERMQAGSCEVLQGVSHIARLCLWAGQERGAARENM
jgi:hypothetical protein